jgi:hypothetical protein
MMKVPAENNVEQRNGYRFQLALKRMTGGDSGTMKAFDS